MRVVAQLGSWEAVVGGTIPVDSNPGLAASTGWLMRPTAALGHVNTRPASGRHRHLTKVLPRPAACHDVLVSLADAKRCSSGGGRGFAACDGPPGLRRELAVLLCSKQSREIQERGRLGVQAPFSCGWACTRTVPIGRLEQGVHPWPHIGNRLRSQLEWLY